MKKEQVILLGTYVGTIIGSVITTLSVQSLIKDYGTKQLNKGVELGKISGSVNTLKELYQTIMAEEKSKEETEED